MEKKVLEMYVSPALKIVELEVKSVILVGSGTNADNADVENPGEE